MSEFEIVSRENISGIWGYQHMENIYNTEYAIYTYYSY